MAMIGVMKRVGERRGQPLHCAARSRRNCARPNSTGSRNFPARGRTPDTRVERRAGVRAGNGPWTSRRSAATGPKIPEDARPGGGRGPRRGERVARWRFMHMHPLLGADVDVGLWISLMLPSNQKPSVSAQACGPRRFFLSPPPFLHGASSSEPRPLQTDTPNQALGRGHSSQLATSQYCSCR